MQKADTSISIAIIHLIWVPYGTGLFEQFVASYCKYKAGYKHQLILLFNGVQQHDELAPYIDIANKNNLSYRTIVCSGFNQDITAYYWAAEQIDNSYILFLNSYCELQADNWLACFSRHVNNSKVGIIGATGSWQSYSSTVFQTNPLRWEKDKTRTENFGKYKLFIKALLYWKFLFPAFPNPHIRTNGFMIKRTLLLSCKKGKLKTKFQAYLFESGKNSLSRQIIAKGLNIFIIDKSGNLYEIENWNKSSIFWSSNQENLLITDNQTKLYSNGDTSLKRKLARLAWGDDNVYERRP